MDRSPADHVLEGISHDILQRFLNEQLKHIGRHVQGNLTYKKTPDTDVILNQIEFRTELLPDEPTEESKKDSRIPNSESLRELEEHATQRAEIYSHSETTIQNSCHGLKELEKSYEIMRHNLQDLERQSTEVSQKLYKTEQQLEESKEETRNARLLAERFRGYIQKGATNANELIDSDIQSKLSSIQHQTTRIVNDYCVGSPSHPPRNDVLRFQNQKVNQTMHEYKNEDPEALHQFLMRHNIYKLLKVEIFDKPVFGLGDEIEVKLKKLEGLLLEENQNSQNDIGEWRALTVRHAKSLSMKQTNLPARLASHIQKLFEPWFINYLSKSNSQKRIHQISMLHQSLEKLCQEAYDFAVLLRSSSDRYYFRSIEDKKKVEVPTNEYFMSESMIGPNSNYIGSEVWVTLFGALVKESQRGERHIIMKASVICKAQPTRSRPAQTYAGRLNQTGLHFWSKSGLGF